MEAIAAAVITAKPKASKPITTKHLAYTLADQHQLTKKQGQQEGGLPRHQATQDGSLIAKRPLVFEDKIRQALEVVRWRDGAICGNHSRAPAALRAVRSFWCGRPAKLE